MEGDLLHNVGCVDIIAISIHSLRMEGDGFVTQHTVHIFISIHSLRMEGDDEIALAHILTNISIHSLRMEGDAVSF